MPARAAGRRETGRSGFCARARCSRVTRPVTSLLWANWVSPVRAVCPLETGGSGFCACTPRAGHTPSDMLVMGKAGIARPRRRPPGDGQIWFLRARAARHPCYGQTGFCPRAPPATLRRADLVLARARRATFLLWANRVWLARAAGRPETGGSGFCARAPRDILAMGEAGIARPRRLPP